MSYTFDLNVLGLIPDSVEYSKFIVDLVNNMIFQPMTS